ncbi:MAG: MBL fold metallo-hydrolase [Syntrophorhabdus sp.]
MRVYFWGTRGSLPASIIAENIREKIIRAIKAASTEKFSNDEDIRNFVDSKLPFTVKSTYGSNTPCIEIRNGDEYLICDAGTGLRDLGNYHMKLIEKGLQRKTGSIFHIFVSHFHWDHIQGFPFFTPAYIPGNKVRIYGFHKNIKSYFAKQQNEPYFPVPLENMAADIRFKKLEIGESYQISGFDVSGIQQKHPGISYGYRFQKDGKTIVYSSDAEHGTSFDGPARDENYPFLEFFKDADLLIFDAQYDWTEVAASKMEWGHSSYVAAVELAVKANVKHLCLFHNEPSYNDDRLDALLEDTRNYLTIYNNRKPHPMKIDLVYDGQEIEI